MDIVFKCPHCEQELEVDDRGVGSTLECPACSNTITVPPRAPGGPAPAPAPSANVITAFHESKHFTVPAHDAPAEALILKPKPPLEVAAKEGDKKMRIKTIKRGDCLEVGRDRFDDKVSEFLERVGQDNIVSINTINYSAVDMATHNLLEDYGVVVVYKG